MIIRKLYIENFGHFHDFTLELTPGLNRLCRENEFGKTTIFEFVRRVLWGYPDGHSGKGVNRYPARFNAGEYGGFLEVELKDGSTAVLERYGQKGKLVVRRSDGAEEDGGEFLRKLSPVSGDCYRKVYAVTLDEITELSNLSGDEIKGRLYGGAIMGGGVSLPKLGKYFDDRAREFYRPRGPSKIGDARRQLRDAVEKRDLALAECSRRPALEEELAELGRETARLHAESAAAAESASAIELVLKAHPRYVKLAEAEAALAGLPETPDVPEAAARRAEELAKQLAGTPPPPAVDAGRLPVLAAEVALLDRELAGTGGGALPGADDLAAAETLEKRSRELAEPLAFPVWICILALPFLAGAGAAFVETLRLPGMILAVAAAAGALAGWLTHSRRVAARQRAAEELGRETEAFRSRLELDCPPEKFSAVLGARSRRRQAADDLAALQAAQTAAAAVTAVKRELDELCRRFGCADAPEMRRAAQLSLKVNDLRRRRAEAAAALDALLPPEKQAVLKNFDIEAETKRRAEVSARRAELERSVSALQQRAGAVANELKHLPDGEEVELMNSGIEAAKGVIRKLVREYLVVRTCRALLDAAVDRYERESQPEVFKRAEALFADFTGGRYDRLYKKLATGELTLCDSATGQEKTFPALSRGSREELMLAMRLALIECTERDSEPLPVCFDDVGVNFDPKRLARAEAAVEKFARGRQVIWFSHE